MAKKRPAPSRERLMQALRYDPDSGVFTWLVDPARGPKTKGNRAGKVEPTGRRWIGLDRVIYAANRLAWLYMTGDWPTTGVDHKDLNPGNDAWSNLRLANQEQNCANAPKRTINTSGHKGVSLHNSGLWRAVICPKGKFISSYHKTREAAAAAYAELAREHFGEFARVA